MNKSVVAIALALSAMMPAPAFAWFGWLDKYSGPGPWHGVRLEWRLTCFNDNDVWVDAAAITQSAVNATIATAAEPEKRQLILNALGVLTSELNALPAQRKLMPAAQPPSSDRAILDFAAAIQDIANAFRKIPNFPEGQALADLWDRSAFAWNAAADDPSARFFPGLRSLKGLSINTTCADRRDDKFRAAYGSTRRSHANLDFTYQRLWAKAEERFANNEGIVLQLFQPRISWRLVPPPYDVVDVGFSIGAYRFSSEGLDPSWGLLIEPVRFDLHLPTRWVDADTSEKGWLLKRIVAPIHGSAGFVLVPGGFRAEEVGAEGPRFALGESTFAYGVTYDALALLRASLKPKTSP
jgi:hypothetical protein